MKERHNYRVANLFPNFLFSFAAQLKPVAEVTVGVGRVARTNVATIAQYFSQVLNIYTT